MILFMWFLSEKENCKACLKENPLFLLHSTFNTYNIKYVGIFPQTNQFSNSLSISWVTLQFNDDTIYIELAQTLQVMGLVPRDYPLL